MGAVKGRNDRIDPGDFGRHPSDKNRTDPVQVDDIRFDSPEHFDKGNNIQEGRHRGIDPVFSLDDVDAERFKLFADREIARLIKTARYFLPFILFRML